jgi:hypothetical protein
MSTQIVQSKQVGFLDFSRLDVAIKACEMIATSSFCPAGFKGKSGDVLCAIQYGMEVGLLPMQALQSIAVINGKPSIYGDGLIGLCQASGELEYIKETFDDSTMSATCTVKRKGKPERTAVFSSEDAKKAGLWNKPGVWQGYPKRMLQMRARGFPLRDEFADILKGLITEEEAKDYPVEASQTTMVDGKDNKNVVDNILNKLKLPGSPVILPFFHSDVESLGTSERDEIETVIIGEQPKKEKSSNDSLANPGKVEHLSVLYCADEKIKKGIDDYLKKLKVSNFQQLTMSQADKLICKIEEKHPETKDWWADYLESKEDIASEVRIKNE